MGKFMPIAAGQKNEENNGGFGGLNLFLDLQIPNFKPKPQANAAPPTGVGMKIPPF